MENEIEEIYENFEESQGIYAYDDDYESLVEDKRKILSQISMSNDDRINDLRNENKSKLNKLKLLLYQKFINIVFSIIGLNLRKEFRIFVEKTKFLKIKHLGYKLETNNKRFKCPEFYMKSLMKQMNRKERMEKIKNNHKNFQKIKQEEKSYIKPSNHELEYKRYMEKVRLEKLKKEEQKKFEQNLIQKENYADNIYKFLIKRKFFRTLIMNLELNHVVETFLENVQSRILKKMYIHKMQFISDSKKEKRMKMELIKLKNATEFYNLNLKVKIFKFIFGYTEINLKMQNYFIKSILVKRRKNLCKNLFRTIKSLRAFSISKEKDITEKLNKLMRKNYFKLFFTGLKEMKEESNDEKLKQDLIMKLKEKANNLIFEKFKY